MRFTAWFKQWFSRRSVGSDHLTLEIDAMVQKFQIVKEAKRLATMGLPAYHEKKPTQKEWEVVEHLNAKREDIHHHCVSGMEALEARLVALELKHQAMQTEALNAEFERQTRRLLDEEGDWLKKLAYNATLRFKELEHFKKKHDLVREANFPSATGLMLRYSVLLFLIGIEGALNAHFFAEGLSTGLIGGFVYAALLAGINVMGCFFLGRFEIGRAHV
mgnify:FL=1